MGKNNLIDDRLFEDTYSTVCSRCTRLINTLTRVCEAFPVKIPTEIWSGKNPHTSPVKGDGGLTFDKLTTSEMEDKAKIL